MKKNLKILYVIFIFIIMMCGCTSNNSIMNYNSEKYVSLYDYKTLSVDYDYTQISDEDMENIIITELSCNEAYVPVEKRKTIFNDDILLISIDGEKEYYIVGSGGFSDLFDKNIIGKTVGNNINIAISKDDVILFDIIGIFRNVTIEDKEFILDYYGYADFNMLEEFIRERAKKEIIFNYAYDIICEKSTIISHPKEIKEQIDKDLEDSKRIILEKYDTINEYLNECDISYEDYTNQVVAYYNECMLYKAILDNEGLCVTQKEIDEYDHRNDLDDYEIYKIIAEERVRNVIISNTIINTTKSQK